MTTQTTETTMTTFCCNSNLVVPVVCHFVTPRVAPVLPVVPVVSVVVKKKIQQIINPSCFLATNQGNGCKRCSRQTAYIPTPCHKNAQGPHIHISGMGSSYCLSYKWLTLLHKLRCANCATKLLSFFHTTKLSGHELKNCC